ncbi:hypothetical protein [Paludibaculum fermentans]|uniref:hypothetical protein n=1 Tax=Paludibaculum fermentans TaxID=1473598 RepID=UPI003EBE152F
MLVENRYTSMNGVDPGRGLGFLRQVFPLQFPWTPGGAVDGRVAAVGEGVTAFRAGHAGGLDRDQECLPSRVGCGSEGIPAVAAN